MKAYKISLFLALLSSPVWTGTTFAMQTATAPATTPAAAPKAKAATKKAEATPPPTAQEIADAKGKGLVWVNLNTHVYHKDGADYGTTKRGKFMTEDLAKQGGYRAAKEPGASKKGAASTTAKKS